VSCRLEGNDSRATCTVNSSSSLSGDDSTLDKQAQGTVETSISVDTVGGKVRLHIGLFNVQAKTHLMLAGMSAGGAEEMQLGRWNAEGPASTGEQTQSGS
jgi:hypothetical protein